MTCPKYLGGRIMFRCTLDNDHDGPCMAREDALSVRKRREWAAAVADQERAIQFIEDELSRPSTLVIDAAHLAHQREWSTKTFGPGRRTHGVIDHIRKELTEIEADPDDLTEWVDVIILALDGAWRHGWQPQQIIDAIIVKQAKNERREWPDWRTMSEDAAIEHVRDEPSHGVPLQPGFKWIYGGEMQVCASCDDMTCPGPESHVPKEGLRQRPGDQPLPTPSDGPIMHELLIEKLRQRLEVGISRYGQPLRAFNGRNSAQDALEEVLDLAVYLQQLELERSAMVQALRRVLVKGFPDGAADPETWREIRELLSRVTPPPVSSDDSGD